MKGIYQWVCDRYPAILSGIVGFECENSATDGLYIDANCIVENICTRYIPLISDVIEKLTKFIDNLVTNVVHPTKVVYIALDGVSPCARLNYLRSTCYLNEKDRLAASKKDPYGGVHFFDTINLLPGTDFTYQISKKALKIFVDRMANTAPAWQNLEIILSTSEVPGEATHKLISYVRHHKAMNELPANYRHGFYSTNESMIFSCLSIHEPFCYILRDIQIMNHKPSRRIPEYPLLQMLRIHTLRDYVISDLLSACPAKLRCQYNVERLLDDFLFLTCFLGNEYLPRIPGICIEDDALGVLMDAYKAVFLTREDEETTHEMDGYGAGAGAGYSPSVSRKISAKLQRQESSKKTVAAGVAAGIAAGTAAAVGVDYLVLNPQQINFLKLKEISSIVGKIARIVYEQKEGLHGVRYRVGRLLQGDGDDTDGFDGNIDGNIDGKNGVERILPPSSVDCRSAYYLTKLDIYIPTSTSTTNTTHTAHTATTHRAHRAHTVHREEVDEDVEEDAEELQDHFLEHWRQLEGQEALQLAVKEYMIGLLWSYQYTVCGCVSWHYQYPYRYAPFLEDLTGMYMVSANRHTISREIITITIPFDGPCSAFQQLLACVPPTAATSHLPIPYHSILSPTSHTTSPTSPTSLTTSTTSTTLSTTAYCPLTFAVDTFQHLSIACLPPIPLHTLLTLDATLQQRDLTEYLFTAIERTRNRLGVIFHLQRCPGMMSNVVQVRKEETGPAYTLSAAPFAPVLLPGTLPSIQGYDGLDTMMFSTTISIGKAWYDTEEVGTIVKYRTPIGGVPVIPGVPVVGEVKRGASTTTSTTGMSGRMAYKSPNLAQWSADHKPTHYTAIQKKAYNFF